MWSMMLSSGAAAVDVLRVVTAAEAGVCGDRLAASATAAAALASAMDSSSTSRSPITIIQGSGQVMGSFP